MITMRKAIYLLALLVVLTNVFFASRLWLFIGFIASHKFNVETGGIPGGIYLEVAPSLFVFLELSLVCFILRPRTFLFTPNTAQRRSGILLRSTLVAICSGAGLFVLFIPLLLRTRPDTGLVALIIDYPDRFFTYLTVGLVWILLPLSAEMVFRGIILKTFLENISALWSLVITSAAFALIWPVPPRFGWLLVSAQSQVYCIGAIVLFCLRSLPT